jgi:DNA-binding NarL/FixJ family response regulator
MAHGSLIVCEPSGMWAGALRRAMAGEPLRLIETRRAADAWQELVAAPHSVLALAWSSDRRAELADFTDRVGRRFPLARWVVLVDRRDRREELLAYELGAQYVCSSPRRAADVAAIARRRLGRRPETHWLAMDEAIEQVWQTLPWNPEERID